MKKIRKYMVYVETRDDVFKVAIPAESKAQAVKFAQGNGEIVAVKDITDEYQIGIGHVVEALERYGFGETETDLIMRTLLDCGLCTEDYTHH